MILSTGIKNYSQVQTSLNQYSKTYFSTSPNASSLGTYGLVPVNLSTGSPDINIDLLPFLTRGTNYNISLSYNLSSVKPESPVAWTGLGWNLNVGGAVTRNINGYVDESKGYHNRENYYDYYHKFDNDNWYNIESQFWSNTLVNDSPDMFLFEINGINGKFYKNHKGKWVVSANQDVSFSIIDEVKEDFFFYSGFKEKYIYGFEITDKYGNTYTFGKDLKSLEIADLGIDDSDFYQVPNSNSFSFLGKFIKTWYLTKIKYAKGTEINFEYESDNNLTLIQHKSINYGFNTCGIANPNCTSTISYEKVHLKYLKKIIFDEGTVVFNRSLANVLKYNISAPNNDLLNNYNNSLHWYKLNSIELLDKRNSTIDKVVFSYDENSNSRLKLKNIKIGIDPYKLKEYFFTYNPNRLPEDPYNNVDHWGFNNGRNFVPGYSKPEAENYYNLREPDSLAVKAETLERIDYPTGGYNVIEYEPNFYSKFVKSENSQVSIVDNNLNKMTGGLRVKKISTYDNQSSQPTEKRYYYTRDYFSGQNISSGVLSSIPNYLYEDHFANPSPQGGAPFDFWNLSSSSYIPLSETNGYHIGYSKIYEKHENGSITEYSYSNYDNGYNDIIPSYPSKKVMTTSSSGPSGNGSTVSHYNYTKIPSDNLILNSLTQERGLLLSKKNYDGSHNAISETIISYNNNQNRLTDEIRSFKSVNFYRTFLFPMIGANIKYNIIKYTPYLTYANAIQKTGEKTINYFNTGKIESNTSYTYKSNYESSPQKITTSLNDGTVLEKRFLYAPDLKYANQPSQYLPPYWFIAHMFVKNMIGVPVAISNYKNGKFISRQQTVYEYNSGSTLVLPKKELFYNEDKNVDLSTPAVPVIYPDTSAAETKFIYDKYDIKGNLQQYTTKDGIPTAVVWGYNGTQPIVKVEGVTYEQLENLGLITAIVDASNMDDTDSSKEDLFIVALDDFRKNSGLSSYQTTTYTYDPLIGITSITPPSGIREVYIYDTANRLKEVRENSTTGKILKEFKYNYKQ